MDIKISCERNRWVAAQRKERVDNDILGDRFWQCVILDGSRPLDELETSQVLFSRVGW